MPVNTLLVEGELDAHVLGAILDGVRVVRRGPKGSLAPETRRRFREFKTVTACYLRDRDFDYDPPSTGTFEPTVDRLEGGSVLGWRWCRHEIENYLIEPDLVVIAMGWDRSEFSAQVIEAARSIRHYQIARWVIGRARSGLPPHHKLETRPTDVNEYRLPRDLPEEALFQWVRKHIGDFSTRVQTSLSDEAVAASLSALGSVLTDALFSSSSAALHWCSGKDLLAALGPWLQAQPRRIESAKAFVNLMRDWVVEHPAEALQRIPEWASLVQLVRE